MTKAGSFVSTAFAAGLVASLAGTAPAMAQFGPGVNFIEGVDGAIQGGSVVAIPTSSPVVNVASDGEVAFDPFGFGADTSDDIQFTAGPGVWVPDPAFASSFGPGLWTEFTAGGNDMWALPAVIAGCGSENEPT